MSPAGDAARDAELVGHLADGTPVHAHTVAVAGGPELRVLELGATVASLHAFAPDADGIRPNVVLGHPDLAGYTAEPTPYFGAVVGRYANRIAGSRFTLGGTEHTLAANEGENCLHGGPGGFHSRVWEVTDAGADHLTLRLTSPDGDQGFPGELTAEVTYRVTATSVHVDLRATTVATTVVNLTNHAYWNLAGEGSGSADGHLLTVEADAYLPVDEQAIPLEHPADLAGTPLDLRSPTAVGHASRVAHEQTAITLGVDHCYLLRGEGDAAGRAADRTHHRPHARGAHRPAGPAGLHRQPPRRLARRPLRPSLPPGRRRRAGDTAAARRPQPRLDAVRRAGAGAGLPLANRVAPRGVRRQRQRSTKVRRGSPGTELPDLRWRGDRPPRAASPRP